MNEPVTRREEDLRRPRRTALFALRITRGHYAQMTIAFGVFALFLANGAGVFDRIQDASFAVSVPAVTGTPEFLLLLGIGSVMSVLLPLLTPVSASVLTVAAALPVVYLGLSTTTPRALLPMEYSLLTILMIFGISILTNWFAETHKRQLVINLFEQYVPPELVDIIIRNPDDFSLAGESRELTVMFCDVHEFTRLSERLEPRELARLLNTLFTPLTRILYRNLGTVDKYIGDEIMAFWGAPVEDADHARHALAAAFEMQQAIRALQPELEARGWGTIRVGIGINTGVMSVGNMGSEYRMAYTVIGDAVNLASRLQALTRVFDNDIIVGEATRKAFPGAFYRELGLVGVRGKDEPVRIYEAFDPATDPESTLVDNLNRHNEALRFYYGRDWDRATELFERLREAHPEDGLFGLYLDKIDAYRREPPPPGWRGELRFEIK